MTLIARPEPPQVGRPVTAGEQGPTCTCEDASLDELVRLMGGGMGQWEASRLLWGPEDTNEGEEVA